MLSENFPPVKAVLIGTSRGDFEEISLDISFKNSQVTQYLGGSGTFIGQWVDHNIVIMKCRECIFDPNINKNQLAKPFKGETTLGPILLIRMNDDAEPRDLTLQEVLDLKLIFKPQSRYRLRSNSSPAY